MGLAKEITSVVNLIRSDLYRYYGRSDFIAFIKGYFLIPGFNYTVWLRIGSRFNSNVFKLILHMKKIKYGIDIPCASIGKGFYVGHFGGIVVNGKAIVGDNCNISHGVTIGVINRGAKKGVPTLGNCVYIGPGAKILGNIRIGNHVAIGANAVVINDVPDYAVVVGIPARIVSNEGSDGYVNNIV